MTTPIEDWPEGVRDYGSLSGIVTMTAGGYYGLYEDLLNKTIPVHCDIRPVRDVFSSSFGKRVRITGPIRYDANGYPVEIWADKIYVFPSDEDLPGFEDVKGILNT